MTVQDSTSRGVEALASRLLGAEYAWLRRAGQSLLRRVPPGSTAAELAFALGRCAGEAAVGDVLVLVAAAIHDGEPACAGMPFQTDRAPASWLLAAALERARIDGRPTLGAALDALMARIADGVAGAPALLPEASPLLDYGASALLPELGERPGDEALAAAGRAAGKLARLAGEMAVVFRVMDEAPPIPSPLLLTAIAAEIAEPEVRSAWAAACRPRPDRIPLARVLGAAPVLRRAAELATAWAEETRAAHDELFAPLREVADGFRARVADRASAARIYAFLPGGTSPRAELARAIRLARAALSDEPSLRESWEVQRWGAWCGEPRVARLFPEGLCLLARARAGDDITARAGALVRGCLHPDGFRYYDRYLGIPPDADDLGLVLQIAARLSGEAWLGEALAQPVARLVASTGRDGALPVWIEDGLAQPLPEDAPRWLGPRCAAVAANVLLGLAEARTPLPEGFFDRALAWLVGLWEAEGTTAVYHYGAPYARLLLARLWRAADSVPGDPELRARLGAVVAGEAATAAAEVRPDGGAGGVIATACHLELLVIAGRDPWPAVTYLAARQEPDGLWPREPLYRCPGKDGAPQWHGARTLTAAVCLDGLVAAAAASGVPLT